MREFCTSFSVDTVPSIQVFSGLVMPENRKAVEGEKLSDVLHALNLDRQNIGEEKETGGARARDAQEEDGGVGDDAAEEEREDEKEVGEGEDADVENGGEDDRNETEEEEEGSDDEDAEEDERNDEEVPSRDVLKGALQRDLVRAVQCGLEQGVFLGSKSLSGAALKSLELWLSLLSTSFPGAAERDITRQLSLDLGAEAARHGGEVASFRWDPLVAKWRTGMNLHGHDLETKLYSWEACVKRKIDDDFHGGYGCALWQLFHTLTVSSVIGGARSDTTVGSVNNKVMNSSYDCVCTQGARNCGIR